MVVVGLQVRPAVLADQQQIANLMYVAGHIHRHLDWRSPLEWLGSPHYWVLEDHGQIQAALACPQDPPGIAWVRLFACISPLSGPEAWAPLWEAARTEIAAAGGAIVAVIAIQGWIQEILYENGFELHQNITLLEWNDRPFSPYEIPYPFYIRRMQANDLPSVAAVDAAAFGPLWRNSQDALQVARGQAVYAAVAENAGGLVGYQLSTENPLGFHLARLSVRPDAQRRGIGAALVSDLIMQMRRQGKSHLTVNTQGDNFTSLALYEKLGFTRTGEHYPVFTQQI